MFFEKWFTTRFIFQSTTIQKVTALWFLRKVLHIINNCEKNYSFGKKRYRKWSYFMHLTWSPTLVLKENTDTDHTIITCCCTLEYNFWTHDLNLENYTLGLVHLSSEKQNKTFLLLSNNAGIPGGKTLSCSTCSPLLNTVTGI